MGSASVSEVLLKAGAVKPLGTDVGPIPKHTLEKEYMVNYSREPCPTPAFIIDQPSGSHLAGAPTQPKVTWQAEPNMSIATLHTPLQAIAQAGHQHSLFRSQQGSLKTCNEVMHAWDRSHEAFT